MTNKKGKGGNSNSNKKGKNNKNNKKGQWNESQQINNTHKSEGDKSGEESEKEEQPRKPKMTREEKKGKKWLSRNENAATTENGKTLKRGEALKIPFHEKNDTNRNGFYAPKGLQNLGNTCFYNSTMQCLLALPSLHQLYVPKMTNRESVIILHSYITKIGDIRVQIPAKEIKLPKEDTPLPIFGALQRLVELICEKNSSPNPRPLFDQISRRVPRFRGWAQQDSHEFLRYLMDMLRQEEIVLFRSGFEQALQRAQEESRESEEEICEVSNSNDENTTKKADERKILLRALLEGPARPIIDHVFGGALQQSIACTRCGHVSVCIEPFFDLSLPVKSASQKPVHFSPALPSEQQKKRRKDAQKSSKKKGNGRRRSKNEDKEERKEDNKNVAQFPVQTIKGGEELSDPENNATILKEDGRQQSDEVNGRENHASAEIGLEAEQDVDEQKECLQKQPGNSLASSPVPAPQDEDESSTVGEEEPCEGFDLDFHGTRSGCRTRTLAELAKSPTNGKNGAADGASTLSVQESLEAFTSTEVLQPNLHAYRCRKCREAAKNQKMEAPPLALAFKRYLVVVPPLVLTLHLKRFEQTGTRRIQKFNGRVDFPLVLDLAPFCSEHLNRINRGQNQVLYQLCGVVSHSGGMGGGHYIAYVRAQTGNQLRSQQLEELFKLNYSSSCHSSTELAEQLAVLLGKVRLNGGEQREMDDENNSSILEGVPETTNCAASDTHSHWFYCSDSCVRVVPVESVLAAQAYMLFYERIY